MAKSIIWSPRAQADRKEILTYWIRRNKSNAYSRKLDKKFRETVKLIQHYTQLGKLTDYKGVRVKVVYDYLFLYEETDDAILLLAILDSRQDPKKLKRILE